MTWGNCLLYALLRRIMEPGSRIELGWMSIRLKLPRFWFIDRSGIKTRFAPLHPRKGWQALGHKLFFRGEVKHDHRTNRIQNGRDKE